MVDARMDDILEVIQQCVDNKDKLYSNYALLYKSAYDHLLRVGFTPEQAIELTKTSVKFN